MTDKSDLFSYFSDLAEAQEKEPDYLVSPMVPTGLVVVGAPPKSYKSTFTAAIAAMVSGHQCEFLPIGYRHVPFTGPVLWLSAEASPGTLKRMLAREIGVKLERGGIYVCDDAFAWQLDGEDGDKLFKLLDEVKPLLIILDPYRNYHSLNENDSGEMIRLLQPLTRWAHEHLATVMLVHHTSKPGEGQSKVSAGNLRGSTAIYGMADGVVIMNPLKQEGRVEIECIQKSAAKWTRTFQLGAWGFEAMEVPDSAALSVLSALAKGARGLALEEMSGCTPEMIDGAMQLLDRNGWLVKLNGVQTVSAKGQAFTAKEGAKWQKKAK